MTPGAVQTKRGGSSGGKKSRSPLQKAGSKFVDELGGRALTALKEKLGLNTELKYKDVLTGPTAMTATLNTTAGSTSPVIAQGLTPITRTGASIRIAKIDYRFTFTTAAATTQANSIRLICVRATGADNPAPADVVQVSTDFTSPINSDLPYFGEILFDKVFQIGGQSTPNSSVDFIGTLSRSDMHMVWTDADTTGSVSNLVMGRMYWMIYYNGASGTPPLAQSSIRYWFVDN